MPPFAAPTFTSHMKAKDLEFSELIATLPGDRVYFTEGLYSSKGTLEVQIFSGSLAAEIENLYTPLGEVADVPPKVGSPTTTLKTRNYTVAGKRTTTIELTIAGISNAQKEYLESAAFHGSPKTIALENREGWSYVFFNGLRWVAEWKGEIDGVPTFTISSEFTGGTKDNIWLFEVPEEMRQTRTESTESTETQGFHDDEGELEI